MDRGIDGYLHFRDENNRPQFAIVSVKSGGTTSGHVRDLKGTMSVNEAFPGISYQVHGVPKDAKAAIDLGLATDSRDDPFLEFVLVALHVFHA